MTFADFLRSLKPDERASFAKRVERSEGYLYLVAGKHRRASPELAQAIERESSEKVTRSELRPDIWEDPGSEQSTVVG